ncbi:MAG: cupin domain-containing protein [Hyphomicrobiales bacterium]|nr:cupin domain-containing protein [Hyphomicrobiales bacterium]
MNRPVINIDEAALKDRAHGASFAVKWGRLGPVLGLTCLGCAVHVVAPGMRAFPFHRHHVADELFFVVSGTGEYRFGKQTYPLRAGDVVAAPAGTEAHQIINTGTEELRYLGISTTGSVDIVDYPDSDKVGLAAGVKDADLSTATYVGMGRLTAADYWDGEPDDDQ